MENKENEQESAYRRCRPDHKAPSYLPQSRKTRGYRVWLIRSGPLDLGPLLASVYLEFYQIMVRDLQSLQRRVSHFALVLHKIVLHLLVTGRRLKQFLPIDGAEADFGVSVFVLRVKGCGDMIARHQILEVKQFNPRGIFVEVGDRVVARVDHVPAVHFKTD